MLEQQTEDHCIASPIPMRGETERIEGSLSEPNDTCTLTLGARSSLLKDSYAQMTVRKIRKELAKRDDSYTIWRGRFRNTWNPQDGMNPIFGPASITYTEDEQGNIRAHVTRPSAKPHS